jgi:photosystem II stability/assembly factor-like uncharacterized protein
MQFEFDRLKSPLTGEVPSQKKYALIPQEWSNLKTKSDRIYTNTWAPINDKFAALSVTQVVYDPSNTQTFYFCTGEGWFNADAVRGAGLWKSTDGGDTWNHLLSTDSSYFYYCQDMMVANNGDVYVTTRDSGLMRSQDGGSSWKQVLGSGNGAVTNRAADLEVTADGDIVVTMGIFSTDGIYISSSGDKGSFEKIVTGIPVALTERIEIATAKSNADVMYCIPQSSATNRILGVWRSSDKGQTWGQLTSPGGDLNMAKVQAWYDLIIEVDPNNEDVIVAGGLNIWRSRDGGDTWQQLVEGDRRKQSELQYVHVDQHNVIFQNSDTVYFTNDGGIYRCDNFMDDIPVFYDVNSNFNVTQYYSCDIDPETDYVIGGTQDNGSNGSTQSGTSSFDQLSWADGGFCAIDYEQSKYVYTTTQNRRVYRTNRDLGIVDTITNFRIVNSNTLFINPLHMDVNDPRVIYQSTNIGMWRLDNARTADTASWRKICRPFGAVSAIATSESDPDVLYFGRTNGSVFRIDNPQSTDENYIPIFMDDNEELPDFGANCSSIATDPLDKNHLVVTYSNYDLESVFETWNAYDEDPTWVSCEGDLPNIPVRWGTLRKGSSDVFYIATEMGVYYTDDLDGENTKWKTTNNGLPLVRSDMIKWRKSDETFVLGTHGRGIFTGKIEEGSNEISWTERGPLNIGGRSRTIMVDPNDPSQKKLWAGSVSGGLWSVQNIDSVAEYTVYVEPLGSEIEVYPNPFINELIINPTSNGQEVVVNLYDGLGHLVFDKTYPSDATFTVNLGELSNGFYILKVTQGEVETTEKLFKESR